MGRKTRYPLSAIFTKFHVDGAFDFELSQLSGKGKALKEITHLRDFFKKKIVNNFHNTVFYSLFRNTNYIPN